jgi:hypothetical protein
MHLINYVILKNNKWCFATPLDRYDFKLTILINKDHYFSIDDINSLFKDDLNNDMNNLKLNKKAITYEGLEIIFLNDNSLFYFYSKNTFTYDYLKTLMRSQKIKKIKDKIEMA